MCSAESRNMKKAGSGDKNQMLISYSTEHVYLEFYKPTDMNVNRLIKLRLTIRFNEVDINKYTKSCIFSHSHSHPHSSSSSSRNSCSILGIRINIIVLEIRKAGSEYSVCNWERKRGLGN